MEKLTTLYVKRAELWFFLTILAYFLMNGAQIFETLVFVPKWTASPPDSFQLLLVGQGTGLKEFWIAFHSLHEITFLLAIAFCWKIKPVRNWLLILFVIHMAVRVWTLAFFAPNIIYFQEVADNPSLATELNDQTSLWKALNYVRVLIFMAISIGLIPLFLKLRNIRNLL
ncbi:MAG: transposase [Saprospirales bacterium]|nr:MAG: transposase [Saprospirales bacterium]